MQVRTMLLLQLGLLTAAAAFGQNNPAPSTSPRLIEKVVKEPGQLVIPYEKYVLPNGLTVLLHEDHSDPLVNVNVTYHVGSAREQVGKSGFAHFFEHMMFQGSDHVADEQHFKLVTAAGGTLNGSTNRDRTNYFETLPNNQLETALWLEADRMGFLLDAVTQKKFETQRATVKNERGQNYDNRPYGLGQEYLDRALFPYGHPYSWLTIGYLEDLDRADVNDLKNFFLRWYGPNNAVLTVAGDVQPAQALQLATKYFGPIPAGPAVANVKLPAPVLAQDRYVHYEDKVEQPQLQVAWPTVPAYHPDAVALDALADILGGQKTGLLFERLEKKGLAAEAYAYQYNSELAGTLNLVVTNFPGQRLDSAEARVRRLVAALDRRGISTADVERYKAVTEAEKINILSSTGYKAFMLAQYQTLAGNPNHLPEEMRQLRALTAADVRRVFDKYIKGQKAVWLSIVPKGKPALVAHADNFTVDKSGYQTPKDEYAGLKYTKAQDNFDRNKQPQAGPNPVLRVPPHWQQAFANGLRVMGTRNDELPTATLLLTLPGGQRLLQGQSTKAGLAELTVKLMGESSEKYTTEELENKLKELGSSMYMYADDDDVKIYVDCLTKNLSPTLALLEERLLHPRFAASDFERLKKQQIALVDEFVNDAGVMADLSYNGLVRGPADVLGLAVAGTPSALAGLTLADVKRFYGQQVAPNRAFLTVVGDVTEADLLPRLAFLQAWAPQAAAPPLAAAPAPTRPAKTRLFFVPKADAPQSEIRIGYLTAMPYDATGDYQRAYLSNFLLGGAFNSRLNLNLREDKGYTYGARSGFSSSHFAGPFTAQAGVRANVTAASVREMMKEINNYRNGISSEDLAFLQSSVGQAVALKYETGYQKASFLSRLLDYNLPDTYVDDQAAQLRALTAAEVQATAQKMLPADGLTIVVVGDPKYLPELRQLGYPVVESRFQDGRAVAAAPAAAQSKDKAKLAAPAAPKTKRKA